MPFYLVKYKCMNICINAPHMSEFRTKYDVTFLFSNRRIKTSFSFHKITLKTFKWLPYILICHCTPFSPWFIILDKNSFVQVSHHYLTSGGYQVSLQPMPCGLIGMYWAKCKQSNFHTSLTTLCSHFLLS